MVQKITGREDRDWAIANYAPDADGLPVIEPIELKNGGFLKLEHVVRVLEDPDTERKLNKTTTLSYSYQYSTTSPEDPNWVLRYEYEVELIDPKVRYPAGHLHVNAEPTEYARWETVKSFPSLHLPTCRLSLEEIVWHLVNEHSPNAGDAEKEEWFALLNESKSGYEERIAAERRPGRPPLLVG